MADFGDLSNFITAKTVPDLDWLDINEAEYRQLDTLPKQNLDVVPDLEALWSHEGEPATHYVPNRGDQPKTMGDLSEEHGLLRAKPDEVRRVVRLAVLQTNDSGRIAAALQQRFPASDLRENRGIIAEALSERGLLGRHYIDASDFPRCHTGSRKEADFVRRYAAEAPYLLEKPRCAGCSHRQSGDLCSVFHKQIKVQVPYTEEIADRVETLQRAKGYQISASASDPRDRIRRAFLASLGTVTPVGVKPQENVLRLLRPVTAVAEIPAPVDLEPYRRRAKAAIAESLLQGKLTVADAQLGYRLVATATDAPALQHIAAQALRLDTVELAQQDTCRKVEATLRREMLKGRSLEELHTTLRMMFSAEDLKTAEAQWSALLREAGLYGTVYSTADSFEDCHEGANVLATYNPSVRAVVASTKCSGCIHNKVGRCLLYGKPLVADVEDVLTHETVASVVEEHKRMGRLASVGTPITWGATPREALQALFRVTAGLNAPPGRVDIQRAFHGLPTTPVTTSGTRREIAKTAAHLLNEGLYGQDLLAALKMRFEVRDITAAKAELQTVLAEQGLQGTYFIDPTVYDDYGRGCKQAAAKHRTRLVPLVQAGPKCASCVHQTRAGFCSVINKPLVQEIPYPQDKRVIQREILASGRSTEVRVENLVNDGTRAVLEYELQRRAMEVEVDPVVEVSPFDVKFGGNL